MVKLHTTLGEITLELNEAKAPATVLNFLEYVNSGFYDGTIFHRVIDNFMVQGGGFEPGLRQKTARGPIRNEADNGLQNVAYSVAMARTPDPHSASSQFFINVADNDFLDHSAATRGATATACSRAWSKARKWSTRSGRCTPAAAAATTTCRSRTSSSRRPKSFHPRLEPQRRGGAEETRRMANEAEESGRSFTMSRG